MVQKFFDDFCNVIMVKKTSAELLLLAPKEDKDLYTYYYQTKILLKEIHKWDQVTNNNRNIIILSLSKQQLLKNTIMKFILQIWNLDF